MSSSATGSHVAFGKGSPSLFTAAHEAAHVVQQRSGVQLKGGVGQVGDAYEQHADAVAEQVVQGKSAVDLLDGQVSAPAVQAKAACNECGGAPTGTGDCPACKATPSLGALPAALPTPTAAPVVQRSCDPSVSSCLSEDSEEASSASPASNTTPVAAALRPPGNCTQEQWYTLQQAVKQNCKTNMPRACVAGDTPEIIANKAAHFARCIAARTTLNNTCFGGGDLGHLIELGNLTRGLANCEGMRVPVPVPQPAPAPEEDRRTSPAVDQGFMDRMAAITGLSGAALIAYLIISEGSRLFPPRNLIPVP